MSKCKDCNSHGCYQDMEDVDLPSVASKDFHYAPMFQHATHEEQGGQDVVRFEVKGWTKIEGKWVDTIDVCGRTILQVKPGALETLAYRSMVEIQHFFRVDHLSGWRRVLDDPESSNNDRFVAYQLLKNACIASGKVLPACQDTGTAIIMGKKGEQVWTPEGSSDEEELSRGIWAAYLKHNLRYSQCAALNMFDEVNTNSNLPVQLDMLSTKGNEYHFLTIAKGGGSANKSYLYQQTKGLLNPKSLRAFVREKLKTLGTSACPPYHVALVIGGTSAEMTMKTVKLASCRYYDDLPVTGDKHGRAFRDIAWEKIVMEECLNLGIGAQFGGKYFAHQVRVVRLPRHGASCPVGLGVSCSADRQILAKITKDGMFIEELEHDPAKYMPEVLPETLQKGGKADQETVQVNLNQPMSEVRKLLSQYPIRTRLSLSGTLVVARDIAHAKIKERLDNGEGMPQYMKDCIVYYAGPAKTPEGMASGSFGPTTAGRMDSYAGQFMAAGGSFISLAKGNRSAEVTKACKEHGGFYLGSIGGPAAVLAQDSIKKVEVLEYPELGMEAVWKIDVVDFPAFIIVDDKGNDFFADLV
jgi:fumarate hydratase class I